MKVIRHSASGFEGIFLGWVRAYDCPVVTNAIAMLFDPALRVRLEPFQPYARIAGVEQAQLEISDIAVQLATARHTHILLKLATPAGYVKVKPWRRQNECQLVSQAEFRVSLAN